MSDAVLFEHDGAIVTLTLNKPETRNPTTDPDILEALNDACAWIAADAGVGCVMDSAALQRMCPINTGKASNTRRCRSTTSKCRPSPRSTGLPAGRVATWPVPVTFESQRSMRCSPRIS